MAALSSRAPKHLIGALSNVYGVFDDNGELPPLNGGFGGGVLTSQQAQMPEDSPQESVQPINGVLSSKAPKRVNPFSSDNLGETLMGIGQDFLSGGNFWEGAGAAVGSIKDRMKALKSKGKVSYGGPNNQFEITEHPDGSRTVRKVPEFAEATQQEAAEKRRLSARDTNDTLTRAIASISRLDTDQKRASAYNFMLQDPAQFGLTADDVAQLPQEWSDTYGAVRSGMGYSVPQYETNLDRDRAFQHRQGQDGIRNGQAQQRIGISEKSANRPRSGGGGGRKTNTFKAPASFILD